MSKEGRPGDGAPFARGTNRPVSALKPVMPSTVIRTARFDPDSRVLDILFTTGRRYHYHDVPPDEAGRLAAAFSKGRYFNARIRDRYAFTEVTTGES